MIDTDFDASFWRGTVRNGRGWKEGAALSSGVEAEAVGVFVGSVSGRRKFGSMYIFPLTQLQATIRTQGHLRRETGV
jgi:hypothetical protein